MAAVSIGIQFSQLHRLKNRSPKPLPSQRYLPSFGSPFCRIRVPRLVGDGVLARAEDKAKASPPAPPTVQEQAESNNEKQLQELTSLSGSSDPICSVDETSSNDLERTYQPNTDLLKALAVFAAAATGTLAINQSSVAANQDLAMALLFGIGYAGIIFEESQAFNKSGVGSLTL